MSTAGIVAEYNPFHNGHTYHIARTRENGASAVVCVMSSWFVQRGETALMHPNARARMALMNGADLVGERRGAELCEGRRRAARCHGLRGHFELR